MLVKMEVEYFGGGFAGFQIQPKGRTIQGELERALKEFLKEDVRVYGSGRTDAKVHALAQVVHFETESKIEDFTKFCGAINHFLCEDIIIKSAKEERNDFHARYSAKKKIYVYLIYLSKTPSAIFKDRAVQVKEELDIRKIKEESKKLIGVHNFKSFAGATKKEKNFIREIYYIKIKKTGSVIAFEVCAKSFLYHMVRNIVGTLLEIGEGKKENIDVILEKEDRDFAGKTAPAEGLYLKKVFY